jgi:hypothetical protein
MIRSISTGNLRKSISRENTFRDFYSDEELLQKCQEISADLAEEMSSHDLEVPYPPPLYYLSFTSNPNISPFFVTTHNITKHHHNIITTSSHSSITTTNVVLTHIRPKK